MWPFNKAKTYRESGLFEGFTDWHSHILPGVDDGVRTMEESLAILDQYEQLGVKKVWLTPHVMEECPNTTGFLQDRYEDLLREYKGPIVLKLASENMLDSLFDERLKVNNFLVHSETGDHLLVETSYVNPPLGMEQMVQRVLALGLTPILAHPERYRYMEEDDYERWKKRGVLFQCNLMSLMGAYGETARGKAEWLLKEGMVDLTGSDLHRHAVLLKLLEKRPKSRDALDRLVQVAHNPAIQ